MRHLFLLLGVGCLSACSQERPARQTGGQPADSDGSRSGVVTDEVASSDLQTTTFELWSPESVYDLKPLGDLAEQWFRWDLTDEERNRLVDQAKRLSLTEVAPLIFESRRRQSPYIRSGGPAPRDPDCPWNDPRFDPWERYLFMASAVWHHHTTPDDDPEKTRAVLELAKDEKLALDDRLACILSFWHHHWSDEAETYFAQRMADGDENLELRTHCTDTLLRRDNYEQYIPTAVAVIASHEIGKPQCEAFHQAALALGGDLEHLTAANRRLLLDTGFAALSDLTEDEIDNAAGYFVARELGRIAGVANEFTPDRDNPRYQDENGSDKLFFADTVRNALRWRAAEPREKVDDESIPNDDRRGLRTRPRQRFSGGHLFELSRDDARPTEIESPNDNCKARGYADRPLLTPDDSEAIRIPSEIDPLPVRCTALPRSSRPEPERHRRFRENSEFAR